MADYYDQFSFEIKDVTDEEKEWLESYTWKDELGDEIHGDLGRYDHGAWWFNDYNTSNLDEACAMIQKFLGKFRPDDKIGFCVANTCSKPILDSFGGMGVFITKDEIEYYSTFQWVEEQIHGEKL